MLEIWRWRFTRGKTGGPALQCGPSGFHVPQRRAIALGQVRSGYDSWPSRNRPVRLGPLFMHKAFNRRVHQRFAVEVVIWNFKGFCHAAPSTSKITMSPTRQCPFQVRTTFDCLIASSYPAPLFAPTNYAASGSGCVRVGGRPSSLVKDAPLPAQFAAQVSPLSALGPTQQKNYEKPNPIRLDSICPWRRGMRPVSVETCE